MSIELDEVPSTGGKLIVVVQCAKRKKKEAGHLRSRYGMRVEIVAHPEQVEAPDSSVIYARPDDTFDGAHKTWRDELIKLNSDPTEARALGLLPAYALYEDSIYSRVVQAFGVSNVFILSAGWGLVRSDYLLPAYDISFSPRAAAAKRRRQTDIFRDFCQLQDVGEGPVVFVGGKEYLPLFERLTRLNDARTIVAFRADPGCVEPPRHDGVWTFAPFPTTRKTNWHYSFAEALCEKGLESVKT